MGKPQVVVITGPTATGKTALALTLAQRYNAEIISADSRQVYRHLDIGTAKPTLAEQALVPHHVIDVVNPDEHFDVARFRALAHETITALTRRGKRAFVVGGTGLYIRALTRGLFVGPQADPVLRKRLTIQEQKHGPGFLHNWLRRVDADAARRLHPNDRARLIRALEVWLLSGKPMSAWQREHGFRERPFSTLLVSLVLEREILARRIQQRCQQMVRDGLVDEVRRVWDMGFGEQLPAFRTIGYAQIVDLLHGRSTLEEAVTDMAMATRRLAKRQRTWLRAEPEVQWYIPAQEQEIDRVVQEFFEGAGTT